MWCYNSYTYSMYYTTLLSFMEFVIPVCSCSRQHFSQMWIAWTSFSRQMFSKVHIVSLLSVHRMLSMFRPWTPLWGRGRDWRGVLWDCSWVLPRLPTFSPLDLHTSAADSSYHSHQTSPHTPHTLHFFILIYFIDSSYSSFPRCLFS